MFNATHLSKPGFSQFSVQHSGLHVCIDAMQP